MQIETNIGGQTMPGYLVLLPSVLRQAEIITEKGRNIRMKKKNPTEACRAIKTMDFENERPTR
jgi:hypothetical protein